MYGSAVLQRASEEHTAVKSACASSPVLQELRRRRLLDENAVVQYSDELAFLDCICLV
jgi:hypothetical protein